MAFSAIRCTRRESSQGPHSQILTTRGRGGGGVRERFIFYTQRNHNFRICLPIKITTFFRNPQKSLCFFRDPKKSWRYHRPKKLLLAKISDPKKSFNPPPPSLKYVSGAPGEELFRRMLDEITAGLPSVGFLDTDSLGSSVTLDERYRHPNDMGSVTHRYLLRETSLWPFSENPITPHEKGHAYLIDI